MKERTKSGKRYITINFMSRQRVTFMRPEITAFTDFRHSKTMCHSS